VTMTRAEGEQIDRLAHGEPVPEHLSACASAPGTCWHAKVWHKNRSGCSVPGCQCLAFVDQRVSQRAGAAGAPAPAA
jgi:hypothetical protein